MSMAKRSKGLGIGAHGRRVNSDVVGRRSVRSVDRAATNAPEAIRQPAWALPLFVAVNAGCNLRCGYCTVFGENKTHPRGGLSVPRLLQLLETAYRLGVRKFRFTGGEPTLHGALGEILRATQALGDDVRIAMTTNGARLGALVDVFPRLISPQVFVSVDAVGRPADAAVDEGGLRIDKWLTPELIDVIRAVRPAAHVRLNYVLTASNADQLPALIEYAIGDHLDVKIFELLLRDFHYAGDRPPLEVFREQYVPVRTLLPRLRERFGEPEPFGGLGGRGIPMYAFHAGASKIVYFDSLVGSHYGDACADCPLFPCQEGLYSLVLDASGTLHPAGCINTRLHRRLAVASPAEADAAFRELAQAIREARFTPVLPDHLATHELVI
ncbi:MAG TPA: radical SAM protein [Conexibacter sp.]|nr:radical SAM protein [Conexibacter sp.]